MKTVSKKLLSLLLVVVLLLSAVPFQVFAEKAENACDTFVEGGPDGTCKTCEWAEANHKTEEDPEDPEDPEEDPEDEGTTKGHVKLTVHFFDEADHIAGHSDVHEEDLIAVPVVKDLSLEALGFEPNENYKEGTVTAKYYQTAQCGGKTTFLGGDMSKYTVEGGYDVHIDVYVSGTIDKNEDNTSVAERTLVVHANNFTTADLHVAYELGDTIVRPAQPKAPEGSYTFAGWSYTEHAPGEDEDLYASEDLRYKTGNNALFNKKWVSDMDEEIEIYAMWKKNVCSVTVNYAKFNADGDKTKTGFITTLEGLDVGDDLLDALKAALVADETEGDNLATKINQYIPSGYKWDGVFYTSSSCKSSQKVQQGMPLSTGNRTVYVRINPVSVTIHLDPIIEGSMKSADMTLTNKAVGSTVNLAAPSNTGKVFRGWRNKDTGELIELNSKGKFAWTVEAQPGQTDVYLEAVYDDEAQIYLRVYANGKTSAGDARIIAVTNKGVGDTLTLEEARTLAKTFYNIKSSTAVTGLFDTAGWNEYVSSGKVNKESLINEYVITKDNEAIDLYLMVGNASAKVDSANSSSSSSKKNWDSSNPKTGDEAMLGTAAIVMMLAAAALVCTQLISKKKFFVK